MQKKTVLEGLLLLLLFAAEITFNQKRPDFCSRMVQQAIMIQYSSIQFNVCGCVVDSLCVFVYTFSHIYLSV